MSVDVSEQSIVEALHKVPQEHWGHVLEFLHRLKPKAPLPPEGDEPKRWTIAELLALSAVQRDAIFEAHAALAAHDYRNDPELTTFEAFGRDDLHPSQGGLRDS
jgi:hypothetical protein